MKHRDQLSLLYVSLLGVCVFVSFFFVPLEKINEKMNAAIFFVESITIADLRHTFFEAGTREGTRPIKVLIVPGHDPINFGTSFGELTEEKVNVELGKELHAFLQSNEKFESVLLRDEKGYLPEFENYVNTNNEAIWVFIKTHVEAMRALVAQGKVFVPNHGSAAGSRAPDRVVSILYGINKWASEQKFDIVIHVHFNDYAGRKMTQIGKHNGFTIYVPERQYSNARASTAVAEHIRTRLEQFQSRSTFEKEKAGLVEEQNLIAIGAKNTADPVSFLIEYGYIYELEILDDAVRPLFVKNMAYQTYAGLLDFFSDSLPAYSTPFSVTEMNTALTEKSPKTDVFLLQTQLRALGLFPSGGKTLKDCPIAGVFGPCTKEALKAYTASKK